MFIMLSLVTALIGVFIGSKFDNTTLFGIIGFLIPSIYILDKLDTDIRKFINNSK
ncbi:hypothetical protein [Clostridium lundense]|uniref:hypothetical protein n=1 Tax=Clostridium lundense TaxID=319475 RepID=UPI000AECE346|nr:hypothetical protein [Clostridium lundense]